MSTTWSWNHLLKVTGVVTLAGLVVGLAAAIATILTVALSLSPAQQLMILSLLPLTGATAFLLVLVITLILVTHVSAIAQTVAPGAAFTGWVTVRANWLTTGTDQH